jgi:hypothetical protein
MIRAKDRGCSYGAVLKKVHRASRQRDALLLSDLLFDIQQLETIDRKGSSVLILKEFTFKF